MLCTSALADSAILNCLYPWSTADHTCTRRSMAPWRLALQSPGHQIWQICASSNYVNISLSKLNPKRGNWVANGLPTGCERAANGLPTGCTALRIANGLPHELPSGCQRVANAFLCKLANERVAAKELPAGQRGCRRDANGLPTCGNGLEGLQRAANGLQTGY